MGDQTYSGTRAAQIVGITYRQLDYWARTNLIRPSKSDAAGSGTRRQYTYRDLLELKVVKMLLDAGIKLESVRDVFNYMRDHVETDISAAHLVISGSSVILCEGNQLTDVLKKGQGVFNILPLSSIRDEVDQKIVSLSEILDEAKESTSAKIVNL